MVSGSVLRLENGRLKVKRLIHTAAAVISAAAAGFLCGRPDERLPGWVTLHDSRQTVTVRTEDGTETADLTLSGGRLRLTGQGFSYESDSTWYIADCFFYDADFDGADEVVLNMWKPGSYGYYHPFWIEPNDEDIYSQHIFIYDWDTEREQRLRKRWLSSGIPIKGKTFFPDEQNALHIIETNGRETVWRWEGWGLKRVSSETAE